jgi:phage gpG-like protein
MKDIGAMADRIEELALPGFLREVGAAVGVEAVKQYRHGFSAKVDPYGTPWARRKREVPWPLMERTGDLRDDVRLETDEHRVRLEAQMPYGVFHQHGTRNMVARRIVPTQARGLGEWHAPLVEAATDAMRKVFR